MYECWAWLTTEADGKEGVIATVIPGKERLGPMVLQSRLRELAKGMSPIAEAHSIVTGQPNRLVHLVEVDSG